MKELSTVKYKGKVYRVLVDDNFTYDGGYFERGKCGHVRYWNPRTSKRTLLHRIIMDAPEDMVVDHVNGNPLDNRKCNLRLATRQQSVMNRGKNKNNTAGFKGVTPRKIRSGVIFEVSIKLNGKSKYLGRFNCPIKAHAAYCKAAEELFGEFANGGWEHR